MPRVLSLLFVLILSCAGGDESGTDECVENEPITKESGLGVVDLECGTGEEAVGGTAVTVGYVGRLETGEVFDSSRRRDRPYEFLLGAGQVIAGWDEGVAGMRAGGVRRLTIPPELGYGRDGFPPRIPPDATLVFEVELLDVRSPED
jgi:FKBP-type peptidyl-prolyl cis-trans isomerase FkpA